MGASPTSDDHLLGTPLPDPAPSHVVVDAHLAHLGGHAVTLLGLELLAVLLLRVDLPHVADPSRLNEVRQL